jgi:hypothetical protein
MTGTPSGGECEPPLRSPGHAGPSSRLLRWDRNGQPLSTLGAPSLQDVTPPGRSHAGQKAVGSLAAGIAWLKGSLHGAPAYPSQRLAAVNLLTLRLPGRLRGPASCPSHGPGISTLRHGVSGTPLPYRFCTWPSGVHHDATACSDEHNSPSRPHAPNTLRICKCLSTFEFVLSFCATPNDRHAARTSPGRRGLSHSSGHGKQSAAAATHPKFL